MPVNEALEHAQRMQVFTHTGLQLPAELTQVDYYCIGVQLKMLGDSTGYARADLAYRLKVDFPDSYRDKWAELATMLGKVPPTIANDALVGEKYSHAQRQEWMDEGLSYSHIRIAANVEPDERRDYLLRMCVLEGWSVHRLSAEIWGAPTPPKLPPSRDVRGRVGEWLETLADPTDRQYAEYYVGLFIDWMEE